MMPPVKIALLIPVHVWGRLASIADRRGVSVPDVIAYALSNHIRDDARTDVTRREADSPLERLDVELTAARRAGYRVPTRRANRG